MKQKMKWRKIKAGWYVCDKAGMGIQHAESNGKWRLYKNTCSRALTFNTFKEAKAFAKW